MSRQLKKITIDDMSGVTISRYIYAFIGVKVGSEKLARAIWNAVFGQDFTLFEVDPLSSDHERNFTQERKDAFIRKNQPQVDLLRDLTENIKSVRPKGGAPARIADFNNTVIANIQDYFPGNFERRGQPPPYEAPNPPDDEKGEFENIGAGGLDNPIDEQVAALPQLPRSDSPPPRTGGHTNDGSWVLNDPQTPERGDLGPIDGPILTSPPITPKKIPPIEEQVKDLWDHVIYVYAEPGPLDSEDEESSPLRRRRQVKDLSEDDIEAQNELEPRLRYIARRQGPRASWEWLQNVKRVLARTSRRQIRAAGGFMAVLAGAGLMAALPAQQVAQPANPQPVLPQPNPQPVLPQPNPQPVLPQPNPQPQPPQLPGGDPPDDPPRGGGGGGDGGDPNPDGNGGDVVIYNPDDQKRPDGDEKRPDGDDNDPEPDGNDEIIDMLKKLLEKLTQKKATTEQKTHIDPDLSQPKTFQQNIDLRPLEHVMGKLDESEAQRQREANDHMINFLTFDNIETNNMNNYNNPLYDSLNAEIDLRFDDAPLSLAETVHPRIEAPQTIETQSTTDYIAKGSDSWIADEIDFIQWGNDESYVF